MSNNLIDKMINRLSHIDKEIYGGKLTQLEFANFHVGHTLLNEFYWENKVNEGVDNEDSGPATTAALLHKYRNDSDMIYAIWASAVAFSIENSRKELPEDWRGEPYKFLCSLQTELAQHYDHKLQYHRACTSGLPSGFNKHIYKPATNTYDFSEIVANLAHLTLTLWIPIRRTTE